MVVAFIKGTRMITKAEAVIDLPTGSSDSCDSGHRPIKMKLGQQKVQDVQLHMYILSSTEGFGIEHIFALRGTLSEILAHCKKKIYI